MENAQQLYNIFGVQSSAIDEFFHSNKSQTDFPALSLINADPTR